MTQSNDSDLRTEWERRDNGSKWILWHILNEQERSIVRDSSGLTEQLRGLEGKRVEVETTYGEKRRFWVGRSTGWKPCHLEIKTKRSTGGEAAEKTYKSVRIIKGRMT